MRILFVEDDAEIRFIHEQRIRERFKCHVDVATTAYEALTMLMMNPDYDVIISDYNMPGGNGAQILAYKIEHNLTCPFIFFSHSLLPNIQFDPSEYTWIEKHHFAELCSTIEAQVQYNRSSDSRPD